MIWGIVGLLLMGFVMDMWYMYAEIHSERVITKEGEDDMDYVELNGELIPYNEEDQE